MSANGRPVEISVLRALFEEVVAEPWKRKYVQAILGLLADDSLAVLIDCTINRYCTCPDCEQPCGHVLKSAAEQLKATAGKKGYRESLLPCLVTNLAAGTEAKVALMKQRALEGKAMCREGEPRYER